MGVAEIPSFVLDSKTSGDCFQKNIIHSAHTISDTKHIQIRYLIVANGRPFSWAGRSREDAVRDKMFTELTRSVFPFTKKIIIVVYIT